jgi:cysteine-rich repeat protein
VSFFDVDEGLAFGAVSAFCPQMTVRSEDAADASRCQRAALACSDDRSLLDSAPRAAELLARLGISLEDGACLRAGLCGNGQLDDGEECDEGAGNSDTRPNACRTSCVQASCGDGVVDDGEDCDDGNDVDGDGCDTDCTRTEGVCGDGVVDDGEDCDDGNQIDGDGCESDCTITAGACGDGMLDAGEECDDGALNSDTLPDRCRTDCLDPSCGDGVVDVSHGEDCEPPGTLLCDADCQYRLPLGPLGVRPPDSPAGTIRPDVAPASPGALAACQQAILRGARRLFDAARRPLERCVARLAHCFVGPDGGSDACLVRAAAPCQAVLAKRDRLRAAAVRRASRSCTAIPVAQLLAREGGLGFADAAASCAAPAAGAPGPEDVVDCAYRGVECTAQAAVAHVIPSAYAVLDGADLDPDTAFPCVIDPEDDL